MKQRLFCQFLLRMPHNPLRWLLEQSFNIKGRQGSENRIIHTIMFPKYTPDDMKPHLFFQLSGTLLGFWSFKSLSASHGVKAKCKGAIVPLGQNCILHFIHFFHKKCQVAGNRIYSPSKIWERPGFAKIRPFARDRIRIRIRILTPNPGRIRIQVMIQNSYRKKQ